MEVNFNVLNQEGAPALFEASVKPSAGFLGRLFFSRNDEGILYDDGNDWVTIATNGNVIIPNLQQVTEAGNSTNQKIELVNEDTTVDALSIALNNIDTTGINIFSYEDDTNGILIFQNTNGNGIIINKFNGNGLTINQSEGNCLLAYSQDDVIYASSTYGSAIVGTSSEGNGGFFTSGDSAGCYIKSTNEIPLIIDHGVGSMAEAIDFREQYLFTGMVNAVLGQYLPIKINGTTYYLQYFAAV